MELEFKLQGSFVGLSYNNLGKGEKSKCSYTIIVQQGEGERIFFPHLSSRVRDFFSRRVVGDMFNRPITLFGTCRIYDDDETHFFVQDITMG
jgi:hypothetical protein